MSWQNCSLVILIHEDIYAVEENMGLLLHLRHIADLVVKAAPLSTGLAADVHGQVSFFLYNTVHICLYQGGLITLSWFDELALVVLFQCLAPFVLL